MNKFIFGVMAFFASAPAAFAIDCQTGAECVRVPEISALEGMAAVAALSAVMLLVWERRRRAG
ncbi:hypothetical protein AB2B41_21850 [Marimonas sp. MJW-29]|uniref:VPEID-CTERM protein sorting domain-containing protein n=1 Tax=Sulfitobacter sediminis TaxID=3234186 RepID=A0ABV3RTC3_9RHOB